MTNGGVDYSFECTGNLHVLREAFVSTHDVNCSCLLHIQINLNSLFQILLIKGQINYYGEKTLKLAIYVVSS